MSEPTEPIVQIEPANWADFLIEFSRRNLNRRARFEVFRGGRGEEENREARLEAVLLKRTGNRSDNGVIRINRGDKKAGKIKDLITNVWGSSVQYDTDRSEDVLEITDDQNTLISLKLESKLDGAS